MSFEEIVGAYFAQSGSGESNDNYHEASSPLPNGYMEYIEASSDGRGTVYCGSDN